MVLKFEQWEFHKHAAPNHNLFGTLKMETDNLLAHQVVLTVLRQKNRFLFPFCCNYQQQFKRWWFQHLAINIKTHLFLTLTRVHLLTKPNYKCTHRMYLLARKKSSQCNKDWLIFVNSCFMVWFSNVNSCAVFWLSNSWIHLKTWTLWTDFIAVFEDKTTA